jgi:hypothetical protein
MNTKPESQPAANPVVDPQRRYGSMLPSPSSTEQRLQHMQALGERINGYIQFMGTVATLHGTSGEAKEKAVAAFHERLVALEEQLRRIQENLRLG